MVTPVVTSIKGLSAVKSVFSGSVILMVLLMSFTVAATPLIVKLLIGLKTVVVTV
ncbi:hypothetical protein D3C80_2226040 [compost metagenome]